MWLYFNGRLLRASPASLIRFWNAEFDNETRFRALAASGDIRRGLELLDKLDAAESNN